MEPFPVYDVGNRAVLTTEGWDGRLGVGGSVRSVGKESFSVYVAWDGAVD